MRNASLRLNRRHEEIALDGSPKDARCGCRAREQSRPDSGETLPVVADAARREPRMPRGSAGKETRLVGASHRAEQASTMVAKPSSRTLRCRCQVSWKPWLLDSSQTMRWYPSHTRGSSTFNSFWKYAFCRVNRA